MYKYPYGDSQQLNLDWILAKLKELEEAGLGLDLEDVSKALISLPYNTSSSYRRYDYAFLNGKLYRCLTDTSGVFDPAAWQEALIGDDLAVLTRWINAIDAAAVVDVKFDTSGTNGKLQQKYHDEYHDVVEVDYTPVQNSKRPLSSNAGYKLNGALDNIITAKRISTIDDLSTSENHFVTFAENISVGGITFPQYAKGMLVTNMGTDASLYAIGLDGKLYTAFRTSNGWRYGKSVTNEINDLNDAINDVQEQITVNVQTSTTASKAYTIGDYLVLNGKFYRVATTIANGSTLTIGTNIIETNISEALPYICKVKMTNVAITDSTYGFIDTGIPCNDFFMIQAFCRKNANNAFHISNLINSNYRLQLFNCVTNAVVTSGTVNEIEMLLINSNKIVEVSI